MALATNGERQWGEEVTHWLVAHMVVLYVIVAATVVVGVASIGFLWVAIPAAVLTVACFAVRSWRRDG